MKNAICLASIGCALLGVASPAWAETMIKLDLCEMKPVFMEDFTELSIASRRVGPARWMAHTPWNGDFGDAAFTDPIPGGPFSLNNGKGLNITASKSPEGRWRSGLIAAGDATGNGAGVQYGYFEARMKLPPGAGTWPAFWVSSLKPATDPAPGVELDVVEYYGHMPHQFSSAVHVWTKDEKLSHHEVHWTGVPPGSLEQSFHTYGLRIDPKQITFYLDRNAVWQSPTPSSLATPMFPLVDLALGSGFPIDKTPNPSTLLVDYVHVYALDPEGRSARCDAGSGDAPAGGG